MRRLIALFALLSLTACAHLPGPLAAKDALRGHAMVVAANPLATEAGLKVLKAGGTAADAAVAIQAVLGLVEPQSSGLGGGAFMTFYDGRTRKLITYNGRETAPAAATPQLFQGPDGKSLGYITAVTSGRSTGVPGAISMLSLAQKEHGRLAWSVLFADAERLGDEGFTVSPRLGNYINSAFPQAKTPDATAYFSKPDGTRLKTGDTLKNPAYAATIRKIAAEGPDALLKGDIAAAIVARTQAGDFAGAMTLADLAAYQPKAAGPVCRPYRIYVVCVPPPPGSGVAVLQALAMLEKTDIATRGPTDPIAWVQIAEAERLMYADRDRYVGDPDFVSVPVSGLLDPAYVAERAKLIGEVAGPPPEAGSPPTRVAFGPDMTHEPAGTSHFVIVDQWGNAVSMTTTVESVFGSGRMVGGFFLNNQLTDFSFSPVDKSGAPAANAVAGGKRPRSSMAPAIILDRKGRFYAAIGSPGGNAILSYNLKAIVGFIDWKLSMQQAVDLPNLVARGSNFSSEPDRYAPGVVEALAARGVKFNSTGGENSGLHGIIVRKDGYEGAADSRREGVVRGY